MERENTIAYRKAKRKVETLKGFYQHLLVYVAINIVLVLVKVDFYNAEPSDFFRWENYFTAIFWGIGLLSHGLYVFYVIYFNTSFFKRWEEKKIKEYLEKNEF